MLEFSILLRVLGICSGLYLFFWILNKLRESVTIKVKSGTGEKFVDLASLHLRREEGAGFDVRLTAENKKSIGSLVVKDDKCWIYVPRGNKASLPDKNFRKIGFVNSEGYIFLYRKGNDSERIGYLAQPSRPDVPTIKGERSWKDLKWTCRLNVYFGDPETWSADATPSRSSAAIVASGIISPDATSATDPEKVDSDPKNLVALAFAAVPSRPGKENGEEEWTEPEEPTEEFKVIEVPKAIEPISESEPESEEIPETAGPPIVIASERTESAEKPTTQYQVTEKEALYLQTVKNMHSDILLQIRQEMVKVEGGTFIMGVNDTESESGENNQGPAHQVTLSTFCIGKYPVTQKIWTAVMGYNPSEKVNDEFPVAPVDWNEATLFTKRLSALTGLEFSLPSEAQWEFAAKGGNLSRGCIYSGSNVKSQVAWDNPYSPVGKKKANELGIHDMSGLVREWCMDWYVPRYASEEQYNPTGPVMPNEPEKRKHVIRSPYGNETVTGRKGELAENPNQFNSYGMRLVCKPDKTLGVKIKPALVGQSVKSGFLGGAPSTCPISDEARGGAYLLFYNQFGKNSYAEYLGRSPYGWADTALLSSLIFSILFLILYFVNTVVFQMPLLGNDLKAIILLTAFYYLLWGVIRTVKIESIESGHSFQPFLDLMNKSVGYRDFDLIVLILGYLCTIWTYFFYDADFIPLIVAVSMGLTINRRCLSVSEPWEVTDPLKSKFEKSSVDFDDPDEQKIPAPEGDTSKEYNWKLDSFEGKEVHAHFTMMFSQSEVNKARIKNPFFLEKPNLNTTDYRNYIYKMRRELESDEKNLLHVRFALQEIKRIAERHQLNEIDMLQFILDFIQESITYQMDNECRELAAPAEYIRYPDEILYDQHGDCDCKAFLAAVFYYQLGYDVIFLISRQLGHAAVAVAMKDSVARQYLNKETLEDITVEINGTKYYFCETTTDGFMMGEIQKGTSASQFETSIEWKHPENEED